MPAHGVPEAEAELDVDDVWDDELTVDDDLIEEEEDLVTVLIEDDLVDVADEEDDLVTVLIEALDEEVNLVEVAVTVEYFVDVETLNDEVEVDV